jgi:hypothetical protein
VAFDDDDEARALRQSDEQIETCLAGAEVGSRPCPLCGNVQSWMYKAVKENAREVLARIVVLGLVAMATITIGAGIWTFEARGPLTVGGVIVCIASVPPICRGFDSIRQHFRRPKSPPPIQYKGPITIARGEYKVTVRECVDNY